MDETTPAHQAMLRHDRNAVKTQIWISVSVYVLIAIIKKRLGLDPALHTLLQIFSLRLFKKMPVSQALQRSRSKSNSGDYDNQLNLFGP